ncbi:MAG: 50S ribosomal protein L29 [Tepidisphaeraceae bacterium]
MKKKQVAELREKNVEALEQDLKKLQREVFDLRQQSATQKIENTAKSRLARRDIARIQTILKQKQTATAQA